MNSCEHGEWTWVSSCHTNCGITTCVDCGLEFGTELVNSDYHLDNYAFRKTLNEEEKLIQAQRQREKTVYKYLDEYDIKDSRVKDMILKKFDELYEAFKSRFDRQKQFVNTIFDYQHRRNDILKFNLIIKQFREFEKETKSDLERNSFPIKVVIKKIMIDLGIISYVPTCNEDNVFQWLTHLESL